MDNRTLVAFGMLLALVALAILKGNLDPGAVKELLISLTSGTLGYMAHRYVSTPARLPKLSGDTGPHRTLERPTKGSDAG